MDDETLLDQYADVLENLETAIVEADDQVDALSDGQVELALDALIRYYQAEERGYEPRSPRLGEGAQAVFDAVQPIAELQLGPDELEDVDTTADEGEDRELTPEEVSELISQVVKEALEFADNEDDNDDTDSDEWEMTPTGFIKPVSHDVLIACLKRIRKSVRYWSKQGGRRGYLAYVRNFLASPDDFE